MTAAAPAQQVQTTIIVPGVIASAAVKLALEDILSGAIEDMNYLLATPGGLHGKVAIESHFQNSVHSHSEVHLRKIHRGRSKGQPQPASNYGRRRA